MIAATPGPPPKLHAIHNRNLVVVHLIGHNRHLLKQLGGEAAEEGWDGVALVHVQVHLRVVVQQTYKSTRRAEEWAECAARLNTTTNNNVAFASAVAEAAIALLLTAEHFKTVASVRRGRDNNDVPTSSHNGKTSKRYGQRNTRMQYWYC